MIVKTSMAAPDIIIRNGTDIKVFDTWTTIIFFLVLSVQSAPQKQLSIAWCEGLLERYSNAYYMSDYTLILFDIVIAFVIFFVIVIAIACDIVFVIVYFFVFVIVFVFLLSDQSFRREWLSCYCWPRTPRPRCSSAPSTSPSGSSTA